MRSAGDDFARLEPTTGGRAVYAVGDVHGRADLLAELIRSIREDVALLALKTVPVLVFVGDYVDRGGGSREVIEILIGLQADPGFEVRTLKGNHEEVLMDFLRDPRCGPAWAGFGGLETLRSYGAPAPLHRARHGEWKEAQRAFAAALPHSHQVFFARLELMAIYGDYAFVHAGVRADAPLDAQSERDLLWIREEFLEATGGFEKVIVHGHTPVVEPFLGADRIGVDTGAYATGVLSAVRLLGTGRRIIQARQ